MKRPQVIISNAVRQHSHQTAFALQEGGMLERYFISIWYKPNQLPYRLTRLLPHRTRNFLLSEFKKRYFKLIKSDKIYQYPIEFFIFILRKIVKIKTAHNLFYFEFNKIFDKWVSKKIRQLKFNIFIGYETSSLESFKICRNREAICILDLANLHWAKQLEICRNKNKSILNIVNIDSKVLKRTNEIKSEELSLADYIFVPSLMVKSSLLQNKVMPQKLLFIPYGVDLNLFAQKGVYAKNNKFLILFVGSIMVRKGILQLLEAYKQLNLNNAELLLIGNPGDGMQFLSKYKGLFHHISYLDHTELVGYYHKADIFVFPSLIEGFSQVVLEAMATGTPVIVSDHAGSHEAVRDGVDGFIIPIRDIDAIKAKILFFYNNREKISEFGKNARSQAEKYSWEKYRQNIREAVINIYNKKYENSPYNA